MLDSFVDSGLGVGPRGRARAAFGRAGLRPQQFPAPCSARRSRRYRVAWKAAVYRWLSGGSLRAELRLALAVARMGQEKKNSCYGFRGRVKLSLEGSNWFYDAAWGGIVELNGAVSVICVDTA